MCPSCRTVIPSRRALRDDPIVDMFILALYPDRDKYEREVSKRRKSYGAMVVCYVFVLVLCMWWGVYVGYMYDKVMGRGFLGNRKRRRCKEDMTVIWR